MPDHKPYSSNAYLPGNKLAFVQSGEAYFNRLLQMIDEAMESIHLQTYIFKDDETGIRVAEALKAAANRKVEVYLLVDGYASGGLPKGFADALEKCGIRFRYFEPLLKSTWFYFGRRMHHKILVTDQRYALIGGINISNNYNDLPGHPAWLDFSVYAEGPVAQELCVLCWKTWNKYSSRLPVMPCEEKKIQYAFEPEETCLARIRRNDWVRRKNEISASYVEMFRKAESHITVLCSYFLPGRVIRKFMVLAAKRGVRIRVITTAQSDVALSKQAERWLYDWLLRNGIEIYEYLPAILHAKVATCDKQWVTIGSYNLNDISAYASIELNMDIQDTRMAGSMENLLENIINNHSVRITRETHAHNKNLFIQFSRWLSYKCFRFIFTITTFYYKRRK